MIANQMARYNTFYAKYLLGAIVDIRLLYLAITQYCYEMLVLLLVRIKKAATNLIVTA
jgi:hypothetical protein